MKYVDGFVLVVPEKNMAAYRKMAEEAGKIWKKHGALEYIECVGEDLNPKLPLGMPPEVKGITFPQLAGTKTGETVVFSYIVFNSREHRDQVNALVYKDPYTTSGPQDQEVPFDMKRAAYGGFEVIVEA